MKQLSQNKQALKYANYLGKVAVYARDESGNIIYENVDGTLVPVTNGTKVAYGEVLDFKANISFNSGQTLQSEFGLDTSDYNAVISANKGELPFDEKTIIWHTSEPTFDAEGVVKPESAEYRVVAIKTSLNEQRFMLKKRVDTSEQDKNRIEL